MADDRIDWADVAAVGVVATEYMPWEDEDISVGPVQTLLGKDARGWHPLIGVVADALREAFEAGRVDAQSSTNRELRDALGSLHGLFGEPGIHGSIQATHDCINEHVHRLFDEEKYLRRELAARRAVDRWLRDSAYLRAIAINADGDVAARVEGDDHYWHTVARGPDYPALAAALGLEVEP